MGQKTATGGLAPAKTHTGLVGSNTPPNTAILQGPSSLGIGPTGQRMTGTTPLAPPAPPPFQVPGETTIDAPGMGPRAGFPNVAGAFSAPYAVTGEPALKALLKTMKKAGVPGAVAPRNAPIAGGGTLHRFNNMYGPGGVQEILSKMGWTPQRVGNETFWVRPGETGPVDVSQAYKGTFTPRGPYGLVPYK